MNAITIKQLNKTYSNGVQALKNVDFAVAQGDFFALLGANGAGKTTLIGILTGLVNKTSGRVQVFEHDIDVDFLRAKKMVGVVPQEFNFNMFEKAQDILVTQAGYFGVEYRQAVKTSEELLKRLSLWEKRSTSSRSLSGGMKRRLMIARALMHQPRLLILDEPTAGVDVELRHGMWEFLRELSARGTTILLTTHYLEEVEQMCRNAAIIKNGEIVVRDRVSNLVKVFEKETYAISVKEIKDLDRIKEFNPTMIDSNTFEVELAEVDDLNDFIIKLTQAGMVVTDFRARGHRLEKLFLNLLRQK